MSVEDLSEMLFREHPVWRWDEEMEGYERVEDYDPIPDDQGVLFIRATFRTADGTRLSGYLVGMSAFYAVGLFVGDCEFVLNLNLPDRVEAAVAQLAEALGRQSLRVFPLQYEDDCGFELSTALSGVLRQ